MTTASTTAGAGTPIHTGTPAFARTGQAAVVAGFSATIASWIVWWLTHLPGLGVPSPAAAALLGLTLVISLAASARLAANPFKSAVFGGVIAGALNLLILGSILGEQADSAAAMQTAANRFRADAPAIILGYLLVTTLAGVIGGGLAASFPARASAAPGRWLARFAVIVVLSFFPLLFIGGAVTGTESGMAVPDAVTSYGAFSALLPMSMMAEPRIFLEHTHRLFGTLVGLNAIALVLFAFRAEKRMAPKAFAFALLFLVITQGIFGAIRVGAVSSGLAAVHGVFAQLVLAFAVITACKLSVLDRAQPPATDRPLDERTLHAARKGVRFTHLAAVALLIQLVFGALGRHLPNGAHAVWTHAGFSVVVVLLTVMSAATLRIATPASEEGRVMRRVGLALTVLVFAQFVLGFMTLWQVGVGGAEPIPNADELAAARAIDPLETIITTAHQTIGATLLALITLGVYWSKRIAGAHAPRVIRA
jgi:cytochrome c oxidase assembly protein subunit 15